ncbi:MAG: FAD-dependent oxidoreductase [Myxococcales bacterium]|nr:FAD-dependent oxidoreductase [Myxococcales bacterium]
MRTARLVRARSLTPGVRELTFDPGPGHSFVPGQWVNLFDAAGDKRSYSIASAPRADGTFDLAVTHVLHGPMSTLLHALPIGAELRMADAQGFFVMDPVVRPVLMVATGTGLAPFRAMLQHLVSTPPTVPIWLIAGHRTQADLLYRDELEALPLRTFRYWPTLSRGGPTWRGSKGWVQAHVPPALAALGTDVDVYVCGLTHMVHAVRDLCRRELGVPRKQVHAEKYD